jgi:metacaspase-1
MKYNQTLNRLIPAIVLLSVLAILPASATKIALIVAIGDYPEDSGWPQISAINDIDLIRSALTRQGFGEEAIFELRNADDPRY